MKTVILSVFAIMVLLLVILFVAIKDLRRWQDANLACLIAKVEDKNVQAHLNAWLKTHETEITQLLTEGELDYCSGAWGLGPLKFEFDWNVLGFDPKLSQICVVGRKGESWVALHFSKSSRQGIVVARNDDFGITGDGLTARNGNVAVYSDAGDAP